MYHVNMLYRRTMTRILSAFLAYALSLSDIQRDSLTWAVCEVSFCIYLVMVYLS